MSKEISTRRYLVRGSVQGVGFRYFVHRVALDLAITGQVRNTDDGSVEVIASGTAEQLSNLAGRLHTGPPASQVRGVEEHTSPLRQFKSFQIVH